jgi:hypothetical protein
MEFEFERAEFFADGRKVQPESMRVPVRPEADNEFFGVPQVGTGRNN